MFPLIRTTRIKDWLLMDVNEFRTMVAPGGKNSRLAPFWSEIKALRADNYTLDQVLEFLKANGVEITITGLSKYIQRRSVISEYVSRREKREEGIGQQELKTPYSDTPQCGNTNVDSTTETHPDFPFIRTGLALHLYPDWLNPDDFAEPIFTLDHWVIELAGEFVGRIYDSRELALADVDEVLFSKRNTALVDEQIGIAVSLGCLPLALRLAEGKGKGAGVRETRAKFADMAVRFDLLVRYGHDEPTLDLSSVRNAELTGSNSY